MNSKPEKLKIAILNSLEEEKIPRSFIFLKAVGFSILISLAAVIGLYSVWPQEFSSLAMLVGAVLIVTFVIGFVLQLLPQPRIIVPGYWSAWLWGKLIVWMAVFSTIQLVLCPDLAGVTGVTSYLPWLSSLTTYFMRFGGMPSCMFACGFLFSGISSGLVFYVARRALAFSRFRWILFSATIVFLGQASVMLCQTKQQVSLLPYWFVGSLVSIFLAALFFKVIGQIFRKIR